MYDILYDNTDLCQRTQGSIQDHGAHRGADAAIELVVTSHADVAHTHDHEEAFALPLASFLIWLTMTVVCGLALSRWLLLELWQGIIVSAIALLLVAASTFLDAD